LREGDNVMRASLMRRVLPMAMMFFAATVGAGSIAAALFAGLVPASAAMGEFMSLVLAATTVVAVASASALDG
jgi:hypothetical protein